MESTDRTSSQVASPGGVQSCRVQRTLRNPNFWRVFGGVLAGFMIVGWVFVIVILIKEERWQLVLVAWLLLYSVSHFCYWYCRRNKLFAVHVRLCDNRNRASSTVSPPRKSSDSPPTYDDILKSEPPPPSYYTVVKEGSKSPLKKIPFLYRATPGKVISASVPSSSLGIPPKCTSSQKPQVRRTGTVVTPNMNGLIVGQNSYTTVINIDSSGQMFPSVHENIHQTARQLPYEPAATSYQRENEHSGRPTGPGRHPVNPLFAPIFEQMDAMPKITEETASMLDLSRQSSLASTIVERTNSLTGN